MSFLRTKHVIASLHRSANILVDCTCEAVAIAVANLRDGHRPWTFFCWLLVFQSRIEEANTSDTMRKTVSMTRGMDMSAEREKNEEARAAAKRPNEARVNGSKESTSARYGACPPTLAISPLVPCFSAGTTVLLTRCLRRTFSIAGLQAPEITEYLGYVAMSSPLSQ